MKETRERFGFRKLSIGLASVCIGATLFSVDLNTVKADTVDSSSQVANAHEAETTNNTNANDVTTISSSVNQAQFENQNETTTLDGSNKTDVSVNDANKIMSDASGKTDDASKSGEVHATNTLPSDSNNTHETTTTTNTASVKHDNKLTATANTNSVAKPAAAKPASNITNKTLTASNVTTKNSLFGSNADGNAIVTSNPRLLANLNKILVAKQPALISKKIANANLTLVNNTLPVLNTNDAYALDEKNGLHEHANVNDNGGYDEDFWGSIDLNNWNYAQDDIGNITLNGYKGSDNTKIIVPNIADFAHGNAIKTITLQVNPNMDTDKVYISSSVMHDLAHNATRIGLSKTENKKVAASDAIWQDAFGGLTNGPSGYNGDGGINVLNPNLTVMDLYNLDTSNITNMSAMFNGGTNLKTIGDLSAWDTGKVTNMRTMFQSAYNLTNIGNLDDWNTGNVTDMRGMFSNASNLTNIGDLSKWNTSKVTNMSAMFQRDSNLASLGDLSKWDTSNVTDTSYMFSKTFKLQSLGDLSKWDTSNITNMRAMFQSDSSLTNIGDLSKWDTSNVTDMSYMFSNTSNLANIGNLFKWDTSNVTNMRAMFQGDSGLTNIGDLSKWDTSNVTDMSYMFNGASKLQSLGNLDGWNTSKVTDMDTMFNNALNLTNIGDLSKWDTSNVTDMSYMFNGASKLQNLGNLDGWNTSKVTDMSYMFSHASNLANIGDLSKWNTSNVTDMRAMFQSDSGLTNIGNLDNWETGNVTDMNRMFNQASNLTNIGDLSKWDTSNVTDMSWMFNQASNLTNIGDLSKWDTSNVTDMSGMFQLVSSLTNIGDLDNWNTGNVTDMSWMFNRASNLTNIGDLSKWDTSKVTNMNSMFQFASSLTNIGDLSKWDTSKVTDMSWMFIGTKSLHNLNISNWNLAKLTDKEALKGIFANDVNLTNLAVIANNITLPTWYDNELNNSDYFWNNHMAVITNNDKLLKATGDIDTLTIDNTQSARSIFYDSKGSSDAIKVLTDANNQYIADYNKTNPSKLLKLADTVDQTDPIALANANFVTVPKVFNITVHFEDVDPNADKDSDTVKQELAKTVNLSGNKGDAADLSQVQLPTNFELSGDLPSATFGDTDSVTIKLKHKLSNATDSLSNGYIMASTNVIAPDGTILIQGQAGVESFIDQRQDLVTGEMVNGDTHWVYNASSNTNVSSDILNKYIRQYTPMIVDTSMNQSTEDWQSALGGLQQPLQIKLKDGYTVHYDGDWQIWGNTDTYTWVGVKGAPDWNTTRQLNLGIDTFQIVPLDQSVHYQFMDNGTQVGSDVIVTGKTGETVAPDLKVPDNYEVADGTTLPTSYTFDATNPTVQINLKHKTETSVESLPATRTITLHLPNNETQTIVQTINYTRNKHHDLVTNKDTYDDYVFDASKSFTTMDGTKSDVAAYKLKDGKVYFAAYKLPKVAGYKATIHKDKEVLTETKLPNGLRRFNFMQLFSVNFVAMPADSTDHGVKQINPSKLVIPTGSDLVQNNQGSEDHGNKVNGQGQTNTGNPSYNNQDQTITGNLSYNDQDQINTTNQTDTMTDGYTNTLNITDQNYDTVNRVTKDNHASVNKSDIKKIHLVNDAKKKHAQLPFKITEHTNTSFNTGTSHVVSAATFGKTKTNQLPQTGASQDTNIKIGIFGLLATLFGLIGFNIDPKKYKKD